MSDSHPIALRAEDVEAISGTGYPEPFDKPVAARSKRKLGDQFGLTNYGVNLVELPPGAWSSQRHWHTHEDELVYVLQGELTLVTDAGRQTLTAGSVAGFPGGKANGHHLINEGGLTAVYLEIGDRIAHDAVYYADIDMQLLPSDSAEPVFTHRDGTPYESD